MAFLSIVSPVYKAENIVSVLVERLNRVVSEITDDYEIILIEDGSPDNSWSEIKKAASVYTNVKGIQLSRNFGQHNAISAGLKFATGKWIVVMDCDLQDQPEEIHLLYNKVLEGYDVVFGRRLKRADSTIKKLGSKIFYSVYKYFTGSRFDNKIANFSISSRKVIDEFNKLKEKDRSFPLIIQWLGFDIGYADVKHAKRYQGKTSYTFQKLIKFASSSIISQSNKPLKISIGLGLIFALFSFIFILYILFKKIVFGIPVTGWASLIVSIFFIGGLILANIGIVGLYIGRIFDETKDRPLYIIKNKIGL